jgi:hypothetical protein
MLNEYYNLFYVILINIVVKKIIFKIKKIYNIDDNIENYITSIVLSTFIASHIVFLFIKYNYIITFTEYENINNINFNLITDKNFNYDKNINELTIIGLITNFIV